MKNLFNALIVIACLSAAIFELGGCTQADVAAFNQGEAAAFNLASIGLTLTGDPAGPILQAVGPEGLAAIAAINNDLLIKGQKASTSQIAQDTISVNDAAAAGLTLSGDGKFGMIVTAASPSLAGIIASVSVAIPAGSPVSSVSGGVSLSPTVSGAPIK